MSAGEVLDVRNTESSSEEEAKQDPWIKASSIQPDQVMVECDRLTDDGLIGDLPEIWEDASQLAYLKFLPGILVGLLRWRLPSYEIRYTYSVSEVGWRRSRIGLRWAVLFERRALESLLKALHLDPTRHLRSADTIEIQELLHRLPALADAPDSSDPEPPGEALRCPSEKFPCWSCDRCARATLKFYRDKGELPGLPLRSKKGNPRDAAGKTGTGAATGSPLPGGAG